MFPDFGATSEGLAKASTMVFRIGSDAHLYDDPESGDIAALLDSKYDSEKCEALKRLLSLIAQGFDVLRFFPQVVKNVASQALEVKKLVYLYLLHYADKRPDEALLSINYFQKDLGDPNPLVRAWALRALAGIQLHSISPLVFAAVNKCARDPSSYVRKCVANALPKLHTVRQENTAEIEEAVQLLLNDNSPGVVGAAAAAFTTVCPCSLFLIRKGYKRLCEILPDVEEWGQILLIDILLRYVIAGHGLVGESIMLYLLHTSDPSSDRDEGDVNTIPEECAGKKNCMPGLELRDMIFRSYFDGPNEYLSHSRAINTYSNGFGSASVTSITRNDDVKLLLQCTLPLLWSRNGAVVLAAATVHWIMAPMENLKNIVGPLLFLLRSSRSSRYVVLCNINMFVKAMPSLFSPHYEDFFICSSDSYEIKVLKLEILTTIATDSSMSFIYQEFEDYIRNPDRKFAADAVAAIGLSATRITTAADMFEKGLLAVMQQEALRRGGSFSDADDGVLVQAVLALKTIIKLDLSDHEKVVIQLVRSLDSIEAPDARAIIVWLVGECRTLGKVIPNMLVPVLKYLARCFISEAAGTKLQILNTAAKVLLHAEDDSEGTIRKLSTYLLELAKHDLNYDIRVRACFMEKLLHLSLLSSSAEGQIQDSNIKMILAKCIFGGEMKIPPRKPSNFRYYLPGSLSLIVLHAAPGYAHLPEPFSLCFQDLPQYSDSAYETDVSEESSYKKHGTDTLSDLQTEENTSISSSQDSREDVSGDSSVGSGHIKETISLGISDSWLAGQDPLNINRLDKGQVESWSFNAFTGDVVWMNNTRTHTLLDSAKGGGLQVDYSFSSEISTMSPYLVCIDITFRNCSMELLSNISLSDDFDDATNQPLVMRDSSISADSLTLIPMEEIYMLEPREVAKRTLHVRFRHPLLALKLHLLCNGKIFVVKLHPNIGYFVHPLPLDKIAFINKESNLRGMFEYVRSLTFVGHMEMVAVNEKMVEHPIPMVCRSLTEKMLSNASLAFVSANWPTSASQSNVAGLCLRFSCEILQNSVPCLITLTVEGDCSKPLDVSVKMNSEETEFALNLLNRIVVFLSEP